MRLRQFTFSLFIALILIAAAQTISAQALDISSGGQPTIAGAVGGSVTGSALVTDDLLVTVNFGEVSPLNTNSIVKVVVPIALRSNQPYQVSVLISGLTVGTGNALQATDIGFGLQNPRFLGGPRHICKKSTHIIRSPFNNDPSTTATVGTNNTAIATGDGTTANASGGNNNTAAGTRCRG